METHPRAHRIYLVLALVAGGMLLAGAFFLRAGASGFAEAATPAAAASTPTLRPCTPVAQVTVSLDPKTGKPVAQPDTFYTCQDHPSQGVHFKVRWQKDPHANIDSFTVDFTNQNGTPFEYNDKDQYVLHSNPAGVALTPGHTKFLGLQSGEIRRYGYSITACSQPGGQDCHTTDPGGVIQP